MSRDPVSVIVAASGRPADFRRCLESLRPTLGWQDEAVCVVAPNRPDLDEVLSTRRWLLRLPAEPVEATDPAARWTAGLAATSHDVVVLLDGDVQVPAHWLDAVAEAFADDGVVAAGPRCHRSFGPQSYDVPEPAASDPAGFKTFARQWREQHRGRMTTVPSLGPVCVAVRRAALARAGGAGFELPYADLGREGRIVLVESVLLAHAGSDDCTLRTAEKQVGPRPLLSACMIVKDEEDVLAECLTSVRDYVDEIVVYDTGSTDRTRQIAAEHGAQVIAGYWNDHFGDARNRALEHCIGEWVLQIDADEVAVGDPVQVRALLSETDARVFRIALESQQGHAGAEASLAMLYPRLFRRAQVRYIHRLHEQIVDRVDGHLLHGEPLDTLRILHSGYIAQRMIIKQKLARNLHLARLSGDDGGANAATLINIGRAEKAAGRFEAAVEALREAVEARDATKPMRVLAYKTLIEALLALGRVDEANGALDALRRLSTKPETVTQVEAAVRFHELNFEQALTIVQAFPESVADDAGVVVGRSNFTEIEIKSLFYLDRIAEAAQLLRESVRAGRLPLNVTETRDLLEADGSGLAEMAALMPHQHVRGLLFAANAAPAELADEILEAVWNRYGGEPVVLAFASEVGPRLSVIRALEWSARLRAAGLDDRCTLVALAANGARSPHDRVIAAAVALEMFADQRANGPLADALGAVSATDGAAVLDELRVLAPSVAATLEVGTEPETAASKPRRAVDARVLYLDLMQKCLLNTIYEDPSQDPGSARVFDPARRAGGLDWPAQAHTMIGEHRLANLRHAVETVIADGIAGDLIETGVWRGGACIFMRAVLRAHGVDDRRVFVADSFNGLPPPDPRYPADAGDLFYTFGELAVPMEQVRANFAKYDLLDEQVVFLEGWFKDTLPRAPIDRLAVLRLDGDMYESTMDALNALYHKVSPGGFVIVDDYALTGCRKAIHDYREAHGVTEPLVVIDSMGAYWRRPSESWDE